MSELAKIYRTALRAACEHAAKVERQRDELLEALKAARKDMLATFALLKDCDTRPELEAIARVEIAITSVESPTTHRTD